MRGVAKRKLTSSSHSKRKEQTDSIAKEKSVIAKEELQDLSNNVVDVSLDLPTQHQLIGGWSIRHSSRKGAASNINVDRYNHTTHIMPARATVKQCETASRPRTSMANRTGISCSNVYVRQRPQCDFLMTTLEPLAKPQSLKLRCGYSPLLYSSCQPQQSTMAGLRVLRSPSNLATQDKTQTNRSLQIMNVRSPFKKNIYLDRWKHRAGRQTMKKLLFQNLHNTPLRFEQENDQSHRRILRTETDLDQPIVLPQRSNRCKSLRSTKKQKCTTSSFRSNTQQSQQCLVRIEMRLRQYGEQPKKYLSHMNKIHQLIQQEQVRLDTSEY